MLTDVGADSGRGRRPRRGRSPWRTTLQAWWPAARGLPLPTIGAVLVLAAAPAAFTLGKGDHDLSGALVAAAIVGAAAVAFAVEDPAGETLSASPTSLARRRALRLSTILLGLALTWSVLVASAAIRGPLTGHDLALRAAEAAAASGLAAAAAGCAHRESAASPGAIGAVTGALGVLVITSLAYRVDELPALMSSVHHGRWWLVAVVGWSLAMWTWRDPARRLSCQCRL